MTTQIAATPDSVSYYRLASLKGMLKMESVGMKSRGGALRPRIASEFGLSSRTPHAVFIAEIQKRMDALIIMKNQVAV